MYSVSNLDHTLDICLLHTAKSYDAFVLQDEFLRIFRSRDSEIKLRGDDVSLWSYISRRYPTVKAADCNNELAYRIRIIIETDEKSHMLKH